MGREARANPLARDARQGKIKPIERPIRDRDRMWQQAPVGAILARLMYMDIGPHKGKPEKGKDK